jgi:hypothetical protein
MVLISGLEEMLFNLVMQFILLSIFSYFSRPSPQMRKDFQVLEIVEQTMYR